MPKRQEIDRIIVGNQIAIMRALTDVVSSQVREDLRIRVRDIKEWWRDQYAEEVGFSSFWGDEPEQRS